MAAPYDNEDEDEADDGGLDPPGMSLVDALLQRALERGTQHVAERARAAAGKLAPLTLTLTGLITDTPEPGIIELLAALPGARPINVRVPYSPQADKTPPAHQAQVQKLVGHAVRIRIEIDR